MNHKTLSALVLASGVALSGCAPAHRSNNEASIYEFTGNLPCGKVSSTKDEVSPWQFWHTYDSYIVSVTTDCPRRIATYRTEASATTPGRLIVSAAQVTSKNVSGTWNGTNSVDQVAIKRGQEEVDLITAQIKQYKLNQVDKAFPSR